MRLTNGKLLREATHVDLLYELTVLVTTLQRIASIERQDRSWEQMAKGAQHLAHTTLQELGRLHEDPHI